MELLVVGVGYVGLVTGACFAEMGYSVTCLDIDAKKIERLQQGEIPIYEPGLEEIVKRNNSAGRLHFTTQYPEAVKRAQIIFLALPTPTLASGECDLQAVYRAAAEVATHIRYHTTIVVKSTVPVGTSSNVSQIIEKALQNREVNVSFDVVSNPEFLKEGCAVQDFMRPDRVIIGHETESAKQLMKELYRPFMFSHERILFMNTQSAELTKYAANTMLATRISFMNWLSHLAEKTGADITSIRKGIGSDSRIGYDFLWAGIGFGGSCFPKDIRALQHCYQKAGLPTDFIDSIIAINERQKHVLPAKIADYFSLRGSLANKTIAILGLSFKPDTDDMREAPSLTLIDALLQQGCHLRLYDPVAMEVAKKNIQPSAYISWCSSAKEACDGADAIALVTEWKQFRLLNFSEIKASMKGNAFFDGRNQYQPLEMAKLGFDYISIGRQTAYAALEKETLSLVEENAAHT